MSKKPSKGKPLREAVKPNALPILVAAPKIINLTENSETYEAVLLRDKPEELDLYLAKEFPDDVQTKVFKKTEKDPQARKGFLAEYLRKLFPKADTPSKMKREIDLVDNKVKAYYLLQAIRYDLTHGTQLKSTFVQSVSDFSTADFENSNKDGKIWQKVSSLTGNSQYPYTENFVFDKEILAQAASKVKEELKDLFVSRKTIAPPLTRLGSYYGLQRYPFDQQKKKEENDLTNEQVVERNMLRFELFSRPEREINFAFVVTNDNINAFLYAFSDGVYLPKDGKKIMFGADNFPKQLLEAVKPFFVKAAKKILESKKLIGPGLAEYLKNYAAEENFDTNPSDNVKKLQLEEKMSDNAVASSSSTSPAQDAPIQNDAPVVETVEKDNTENQLAQNAANVLVETEKIVASEQVNLCDDVVEAAKKAEEKAKEIEKFITQLDEKSVKVQEIMTKQDSLIEQLMVLKGKHTMLEGSNASVQAELLACQSQKLALEEELLRLKSNIEELEKKIKELEQKNIRLRDLSEKILQEIVEHDKKVVEILQLTEKIEFSLAELEAADQNTSNLLPLKEKLALRAEAIQKRVEQLKEENNKVCQQGDENKKECDQARTDLGENIQKITNLQTEIDKNIEKEEKLKKDLIECQQKTDKLQAAFVKFCDMQREYFKRLNEQFDGFSKKLDSSVTKLSDIVTSQSEKVKSYEEKMQEAKAESAV